MTHSRPLSDLRAALAATTAVLLAAFLTACAGLPHDGPQAKAEPVDAYATAQSFRAADASWPQDQWWTAYGDAQLDGLIDEALKGSPTLAQAASRVGRADALAGQARAAAGPNLSVNGSVVEDKESYNNGIPAAFVPHGFNDYGRFTLNFNWELDFWGKNRAAIAAATSDAAAARADAAQARLMLAVSVANAYAELSRLYAQRDLAEQSLDLRQQTEGLVAQRVANGLDTRGELSQAQAAPPSSRADVIALDEQIALTRNQIAALMGEGPDRGLAIARPSTTALKPFGLPATLAADLVGRRPDVTAARWRAEAASQRIKQARAGFYPNINIAAFIGTAALHLDNLTASGSDIGQAGPALSLPIFDSGRLRANLRGQEAGQSAAVADYDAAVVQALHEVADVATSERALTDRLAQSRASLQSSEEGYRIARLRYQGRLSTFQDVLIAEQDVLTRRRVVVDLESRALNLDIALVRALGGGFTAA